MKLTLAFEITNLIRSFLSLLMGTLGVYLFYQGDVQRAIYLLLIATWMKPSLKPR